MLYKDKIMSNAIENNDLSVRIVTVGIIALIMKRAYVNPKYARISKYNRLIMKLICYRN